MYKYFTWTDSHGYHKGQDLLESSQIASLLQHMKKPSEAYATIQDYDADGNITGCPMYFDIDSPSLEEAFWNMSSLVDDLSMDFEVTPAVWFSGSKGFHIVLPLYIRHPRCHEIAGMIAKEYKQETDPSVYRLRSMWRCDRTWNGKGKNYKTRITSEESYADIMRRSKGGSHLENWQPFNVKDMDITSYVSRLPERKTVQLPDNPDTEMMPCLKKLWQMAAPPEGRAHQLCHLVSRWCYQSRLTEEEAVALFNDHPFWKGVAPRDYEKVIASTYRTGRAAIGCETGRDAELLRSQCQLHCPFNKEFQPQEVFNVAKV
ncbi:hypothetical protein [Zhongshania sp.]|uniref:hypothetical protein n=1 Tax=Zhongshania sp. TaxID=1971902 RepID=UPI003563F3F2